MDSLGMNRQFSESRIGGKKLDIIVASNLLSNLLEDGFSQRINSFIDLNLENDLFFVIDEQGFDRDKDALGQISL